MIEGVVEGLVEGAVRQLFDEELVLVPDVFETLDMYSRRPMLASLAFLVRVVLQTECLLARSDAYGRQVYKQTMTILDWMYDA